MGVFFLALLVGTLISFWKYGPYIDPDTIGYFKMILGNKEDLGTLSPFYSFILSVFPFSTLSVFDRALVSGILMFFLAFILLFKITKKLNPNYKYYFFALGSTLLSWWSFRVLGSAHADSHFYILFLLWLYLFIWKKERSNKYFIIIACLSALMVWIKLNALFLIPLLSLWVLISKEKRWIYVIVGTIISWLSYRWMLPENILDLHLSNQVVLQIKQTSPITLFYENLSAWFQVSLGMLLSDLVTQYLPVPLAFLFALSGIVLLLYYLVKFRMDHDQLIYKLLLISTVYSLFFLGFEQWIGYREINYRTLFPHLLVLSFALWIYLIQNRIKSLILIIGFLMASYTLSGHWLIWQRNDVSSLIRAKNFDKSRQKESIERILAQNHQQIFTNSPERIMLSFLTTDVQQIAPKNRFIEGKNYPLSKEEIAWESQKSIRSLGNGSAIVVLFHPDEAAYKTYNIPGVKSIRENNMLIFYSDKLAQ